MTCAHEDDYLISSAAMDVLSMWGRKVSDMILDRAASRARSRGTDQVRVVARDIYESASSIFAENVDDGLPNLLAAAPSPLTSVIEWVPVSERLPEDDSLVLIVDSFPETPAMPGYFDGRTWRAFSGAKVAIITHWAELPRPPESEEER